MLQIKKWSPFLHRRIWDEFCNIFSIDKRLFLRQTQGVSKMEVFGTRILSVRSVYVLGPLHLGECESEKQTLQNQIAPK